MVFTEFNFNKGILCLVFTFLFSISKANASTDETWPVFAAQLSDKVLEQCQTQVCELNVLDSSTLEQLLKQHPLNNEILDALTLSEYELLVSSAIISSASNQATLILEMTTTWRGIPVDDFNLESSVDGVLAIAAEVQIDKWVAHVQAENVFDAQRIYQIIGASDYHHQMQLPEKIGEFILVETALYHDPMQGSITRYAHPEFVDAIVDVSVYPVSPFVHQEPTTAPLENEMQIEKSHIQQLISKAQLDDYQISEIQSTHFSSAVGDLTGLSMEVALQTKIDPIYSTQFLFTQNDKFIKLTGNLPKHMMLALVQESIGQIKVPEESAFMHSMRQR